MARNKMVNGEVVPMTTEEESARDAEELAWASRPAEKRHAELADIWDVVKAKTGATDADLPADVEAPVVRGS